MEPDQNAETESRKRLMALMTRHQRQMFSYIYVLVPNRSDAEDLLQETSLVICEKFHEFREGTDFVAWACQIAYWRGGGFRGESGPAPGGGVLRETPHLAPAAPPRWRGGGVRVHA